MVTVPHAPATVDSESKAQAATFRDRYLGVDVFVSYAWKDASEYTTALIDQLETREFRCFRDTRHYNPGDPLDDVALRWVKNSRMMVVVVSPEALKSPFVRQEAELFLRHRRNFPLVQIYAGGRKTRALVELVAAGSSDSLACLIRNKDLIGKRFIWEDQEDWSTGSPTPQIVDRICRSYTSRKQDQRATLLWKSLFLGIVFVTVPIIVFLALWLQAKDQINRDMQWRVLDSISREALAERTRQPVRSAIVGLEALRMARKSGGGSVLEMEQRLRKIVASFHSVVVGGFQRSNRHHALSEDRRWLVAETEDGRVALYDLGGGGEWTPCAFFQKPQTAIREVAAHPGGKLFATVGNDGATHLWRAEGHDHVLAAQLLAPPDPDAQTLSGDSSAPRSRNRHVLWSPRGSWLAVSGIHPEIALWRFDGPSPDQRTLRGHTKPVEFLHFTPDEALLVTASSDYSDRAVRVWDLRASDPPKAVQRLPEHDHCIRAMVLTPDGRWVFAGDERASLRMTSLPFDPARAQCWKGGDVGGMCQSLILDPTGRFLLVGRAARGRVAYSDLEKEGLVEPAVDLLDLLPPNPKQIPLSFPKGIGRYAVDVTSVAFAPDGKHFVVGFREGGAFMFDRALVLEGSDPLKGLRRLPVPIEDPVDLLEFSQDGRWLALASTQAKTVRVLSLNSASPSDSDALAKSSGHEDHEANIAWLAFRGDNLDLLSGDAEGVVRRWDLRDRESPALPRPLSAGGETVKTADASRDLDRFATWGSDHRLRVWAWNEGRPTSLELPGLVSPDDSSKVADMVWGAGGERLALATEDESDGPLVQLWRVPKEGQSSSIVARHEYTLDHKGPFHARLVLSPDEAWLAVIFDDHVEVLDTAHGLAEVYRHPLEGLANARVTFTPDSHRLLIAPATAEAVLVDVATHVQVPLPRGLTTFSLPLFASNGKAMYAVSQGAKPCLVRWEHDRAGGIRETASVSVPNESELRALSDDDRLLAVATKENKVPAVCLYEADKLNRATLPELPHISGDSNDETRVVFAAFVDDSPILVTGTDFGRFRLWDLSAGTVDMAVIEPSPEKKIPFDAAAYSRKLRLLYLFRQERTKLWDLSPLWEEQAARAVTGRNFTKEEWNNSPLQNVTPVDVPRLPADAMR